MILLQKEDARKGTCKACEYLSIVEDSLSLYLSAHVPETANKNKKSVYPRPVHSNHISSTERVAVNSEVTVPNLKLELPDCNLFAEDFAAITAS